MSNLTGRYRVYPVVVVVATAFGLFAVWQLIFHWVFMVLVPVRGMFASHTLSLAAETVFAALLTIYFTRVVAKQNRALQELDRQKNALVDTLVHDLRQPLTAVVGGLSSLAHSSGLPDQLRELAAIAQDGASELLHLVSDLLDVSRLEAGKPLMEIRGIPPEEFIRHALRVVEPAAAEKGVAVHLDLPPDLPDVKGDAERLHRVLMNLLGNAVKFTGSGGQIRVAAVPNPARRSLEVSVSDTGIGMPPEEQRRVFDKFFAGKTASATTRSSAGLGLYYCKLTVEAHGGEIWVESRAGEGATFRFTLPLAEERR